MSFRGAAAFIAFAIALMGVSLTATPASADAVPGTLTAVTPARILNKTTVAAGGTITLTVAGHGGVPATGAGAVVLNVTATKPTRNGYVTVYPSGEAKPGNSSLNFASGQTIPNHVTVKIGADGKVKLFNGSPGSVTLLADVLGWYAAGEATEPGTFTAVTPARILNKTTVPAGGTIALTVAGAGGVPESGVGAVVLNVTVAQPTANGYLTAYPSGTTRPNASNLNFVIGQTIPNAVTVKVGDDGKVAFFNGSAGTVQVIVDVGGWFTSGAGTVLGSYTPLDPARILPKTAVAAGKSVNLEITGAGGAPPSEVGAVVLNVTVTQPTKGGFVAAYPSGAPNPGSSNLNFVAGQTIPNLVTVKVGANGRVRLFNGSTGTVTVLADIAGVYKGAPVAETGVERVSVANNGTQMTTCSMLEDMTPDSRFVLFALGTCDATANDQLYVRDRQSGTTEFVANTVLGGYAWSSISDDGRYIVFSDFANGIVAVRDTADDTYTRIDGNGGVVLNDYIDAPSISGNGLYVAFTSSATNVVSGDTNGHPDLFLWNRVTGQSAKIATPRTYDYLWGTDLNHDGSKVAAVGTVGEIDAGLDELWVSDTVTGTYSGVANGTNPLIWELALSADGTHLAFVYDDGYGPDVLRVRNLTTSTSTDVPLETLDWATYRAVTGPSISPDGQHVSYVDHVRDSSGTWYSDAFVYRTASGTNEVVPVSLDGAPDFGPWGNTAIGAGGQLVAFDSKATAMVLDDTNETNDVFLRDFSFTPPTAAFARSDATSSDGAASAASVPGRRDLLQVLAERRARALGQP